MCLTKILLGKTHLKYKIQAKEKDYIISLQ